jgi:glycerophosphoryl diester phosphodiesterase
LCSKASTFISYGFDPLLFVAANLMITPSIPLDRAAYVRAIAHRGLHDAKRGLVENSGPAFEAALGSGCGVECDLQPAADGTPYVFHDFTFERLIDAQGAIAQATPDTIGALRYRNSQERILSFADFLDLCGGRGPLLVEIKSDWQKPHALFLEKIAAEIQRYKGPVALMSFDPGVMVRMAELAPKIPRGIVSGVYAGEGWNVETLGAARADRLTHLLESGPVAPSFYAYHVAALPTPVTRYIREVQGLPLFTWTVRSAADRETARAWADAPIFEGPIP